VRSIDYPPAKLAQFEFSPDPLPVYADRFTITLHLAKSLAKPIRIALQYQACNDTACLSPATTRMDVTPYVA